MKWCIESSSAMVLFANLTLRRGDSFVYSLPQKLSGLLLQEAEHLLPRLTRSEKAQLLQSVINDIGDASPGIESRNGVCGGEPCITRTRIPVWLLEQARRLDVSEADIQKIYPTLRAEDLAHAWAYVRSHRSEIETQIIENESA